MIVYFLRHANAGEKMSNPKKYENSRPLDEDGHSAMRNRGKGTGSAGCAGGRDYISPLKPQRKRLRWWATN